MRILIIGGSGLISTAITRQLVQCGENVTLYNRGKSPLRIEDKVQHIQGDRRDFAAFEKQMSDAERFDCIIDMVCYTPEEANSAVRAFSGRTGQYIFCSTVDVYTRPADGYPYYENSPRNPRSEYGKNKAHCEDIFLQAHRQGKFPVTILRPAHTYGEGGSIIHTLGWSTTYLDRIRKGKPIVVHGDGNSLWVSCHVDDVARAFVVAAGKQQTIGRSYHLTGEDWRSWNRYHQQVAEALGAPDPQLVHIPTELLARIAPKRLDTTLFNFQFSNIFDNTAARNELDFRYTVPWLDGVRRTVAWLDEHNRIENSDNDPFDDQVISAWQRLSTQMIQELEGLA
ncbi:NAD-dependent epimerase/dehydratase family protein [Tengunoibacter tsumagoiensis]|uniref:NAD-dependent epimerase/dehydratase domain-containing protein n=1 Tax=Tengunoibacter tsumagoiensis TaxID=2014871 RepID=A0A401ZV52_9CHLR|nr:NAD-dependent epimerase/dehydratase family protein [Tengunoibacter tsumagoiensis]GCE10795.1 hypothetical protein KTT_06540 [Tengunoibacter tsumagoiensis]